MGRVRPNKEWKVKEWKMRLSQYVPQLEDTTNRHFANHDKAFMAACAGAKIAPTKQQASRFKRKHGAAYRWHEANK